jgi:spermidine/putrescine-binding protein
MSKHTPGPWVTGNGKNGTRAETSVYAEIGDIYVKIAWCDATLGYPHCVANARLIAAAPDLLEALKTLPQSLAATDDDLNRWLERAKAAIAKAEGI